MHLGSWGTSFLLLRMFVSTVNLVNMPKLNLLNICLLINSFQGWKQTFYLKTLISCKCLDTSVFMGCWVFVFFLHLLTLYIQIFVYLMFLFFKIFQFQMVRKTKTFSLSWWKWTFLPPFWSKQADHKLATVLSGYWQVTAKWMEKIITTTNQSGKEEYKYTSYK